MTVAIVIPVGLRLQRADAHEQGRDQQAQPLLEERKGFANKPIETLAERVVEPLRG